MQGQLVSMTKAEVRVILNKATPVTYSPEELDSLKSKKAEGWGVF